MENQRIFRCLDICFAWKHTCFPSMFPSKILFFLNPETAILNSSVKSPVIHNCVLRKVLMQQCLLNGVEFRHSEFIFIGFLNNSDSNLVNYFLLLIHHLNQVHMIIYFFVQKEACRDCVFTLTSSRKLFWSVQCCPLLLLYISLLNSAWYIFFCCSGNCDLRPKKYFTGKIKE